MEELTGNDYLGDKDVDVRHDVWLLNNETKSAAPDLGLPSQKYMNTSYC